MSSPHPRVRLGLLAALLAAGAAGVAPAEAQTWRSMTSAREVSSREPLEVELRYGAGELDVRPAEAPLLYRMELRYDEEHFAPLAEYQEGKRLRLGATTRRKDSRTSMREGSRARIELTRDVPLDLALEFGAGRAEIDLGGVSLQRLRLSTGASETRLRFEAPNPVPAEEVSIEAGAADLRVLKLGNARARRIRFQGGVGTTVLDFGGAWTGDATASVQLGIGAVTLRFPRELGVRLDRNSLLSRFDAEGMVRRGDSYYSPNWDRAAHRLTLDVNAAFGSIDVEWIN